MTSGTNNPENTTTPPAAEQTEAERYAAALARLGRPLVATEVALLNAQTGELEVVNLNGIDAATAARLRGQLPAMYQDQAQEIAALLENFQSMSSIQLPEGMNWEQVFGAVNTYVGKPAGAALSASEQFIASHQNEIPLLRSAVSASRRARGIVDTANGTAEGLEAFGQSFANGSRGSREFFGIGRRLDIMAATNGGRPLTDAQRQAVADTLVLASYQSAQSRGTAVANADVALANAAPNLGDNIWSWAQWFGSMIVHVLPDSMGQGLLQFTNFVGSGFRDWEAAGTRAQETLAEEQGAPTREAFAQRNAESRVRKSHERSSQQGRADAAQMLTGVNNVEGVNNIGGIASMIAEGGAYRGDDGNIYIARYVDGQLQREAVMVTGADGQQRPLNVSDEIAQTGEGMGPVMSSGVVPANLAAYVAGMAVDAPLTYGAPVAAMAVGRGIVEGAARQTIGGESARVRSDHLNNGRFNRNSVVGLQNRADAAVARADELAGGARRMPFERTEQGLRTQAAGLASDASDMRARSALQADVWDARSNAFNGSTPAFGGGAATQPASTGVLSRGINHINAVGNAVDNAQLGSFGARATTQLGGNATGFWGGLRSNIWHAPGRVGRVIGDMGGRVVDGALHQGARLARGTGELISHVPGGARVVSAVEMGAARVAPVVGFGLRRIAPPIGAAVGIGENLDSLGIDAMATVRGEGLIQERDTHDRIRGGVSLGVILAAGGAGAVQGAAVGGGVGAVAGAGVGAAPGAVVGGIIGFCGAAATAALATWAGGMAYDHLDRPYQGRMAERRRAEAELNARQNGAELPAGALGDMGAGLTAANQAQYEAAARAQASAAAGTLVLGSVVVGTGNRQPAAVPFVPSRPNQQQAYS